MAETLDTLVQTSSTSVPQTTTNSGANTTTTETQNVTETIIANAAIINSQKEKAEYAEAIDYKGNTFLNIKLATIDEKEDIKTTFNKEFDMKIVCFFIPKYNKGEDFYNPENAIYIPYSEYVQSITLEDSLDSIGMKGEIEISNMGGALDGIFERHNNFYFVINFTQYVSGGKSIKYEPYIFDIASVETITKGYKREQVIKLRVVDIITSILQSHSIASFIKFEGTEVTKARNYKYLFSKIINYVKRFVKINTDNYFEFKKDVIFDERTVFNGADKLNGYDADLDLGLLIEASFNKIDRNASIWEALQVFLKDCVTSIKMSQAMKNSFENIGDVLIPFFFKEEYADRDAIYYNLWNQGDDIKLKEISENEQNINEPGQTTTTVYTTTSQQSSRKTREGEEAKPDVESRSQDDTSTLENTTVITTTSSNTITTNSKASEIVQDNKGLTFKDIALSDYGGNSLTLALRNITMRDFFMPFYLCFSYTDKGGPYIFEDINDAKIPMSTLNGKINDNLQSLTFHSIDKATVDKRWKNAIFLSVNGSGSDCTLIFFDWFYKFFLKAFLNSSKVGGTSKYISNVIPDFYLFSLRHGVGYAAEAKEKTFNNMFDEYNAYTVALDTKDTANEALREMGKNLASLVLLNDSFKLSLKGNLLRRPNEIIRLNVSDQQDGTDMQLPIFTNLSGDSSLFVYIRQVTHVFRGDTYINNIIASKICESVSDVI